MGATLAKSAASRGGNCFLVKPSIMRPRIRLVLDGIAAELVARISAKRRLGRCVRAYDFMAFRMVLACWTAGRGTRDMV